MKKKLAVIVMLVVLASLSVGKMASAYMDEILILEQKEITKLNDEQLTNTFIDVIVEMEASKTFHTTSGFTPKEYTAYKNLLRYRIKLLTEIRKRELEVPSLDK